MTPLTKSGRGKGSSTLWHHPQQQVWPRSPHHDTTHNSSSYRGTTYLDATLLSMIGIPTQHDTTYSSSSNRGTTDLGQRCLVWHHFHIRQVWPRSPLQHAPRPLQPTWLVGLGLPWLQGVTPLPLGGEARPYPATEGGSGGGGGGGGDSDGDGSGGGGGGGGSGGGGSIFIFSPDEARRANLLWAARRAKAAAAAAAAQ
eukprot:scaffold24902_cov57-Phaeocystis_antarctica.AAC.1